MTIVQMTKRLAINATKFSVADEKDKAEACMQLIALIKTKGFEDIRGKLIDNI